MEVSCLGVTITSFGSIGREIVICQITRAKRMSGCMSDVIKNNKLLRLKIIIKNT